MWGFGGVVRGTERVGKGRDGFAVLSVLGLGGLDEWMNIGGGNECVLLLAHDRYPSRTVRFGFSDVG